MSVRVRFAPSPTGNVHIGNIRAAIFNWLFARHLGGQFLLRVEDTDRERSTQEAIQTLLDCMAWLRLDYDEPEVYQSRQTQRHLEVAESLLARGLAYREAKGGGGECVIFRMPKTGELAFHDLVKGTIRKQAKDTQDFVIVRSDGTPVFHLANVVDDIDMAITHVIRGDDHVENTFKHLELFKALSAPLPEYAHLPMIVNHQGKPYSKRDGAAFVGDFRDQGYLPDALFNFLVLLGWAPGDDREVMTREELISEFSLERCKASAARFDTKKLIWMNGEYIRRQPRDLFRDEFVARVKAEKLSVEGYDLEGILDQMQIRTKFYSEIPSSCAYFFTEDYSFDPKGVSKRLKGEGVTELLGSVATAFEALPEFTMQSTHQTLTDMSEKQGVGLGVFVHPVRMAVSGLTEGPGLFEMLALLGRERTCARLRKVVGLLIEQKL